MFRQNDQSGGSGTLGITDIRAAFKKLHLSLTTDETVLIVLSLRQRNRDSKLSLNYFKLLRAVSLFCFCVVTFDFFLNKDLNDMKCFLPPSCCRSEKKISLPRKE